MKEQATATISGAVGRPGLGYEEVAAAADRLMSRNERPTLKNVRAELGSGSMNTIQRHLADWRQSHRRIETTSLTLPVEVQRVIIAEIERATATARAALESDLADVQADRETLGEENQRQGAVLAIAERRVEELSAEIERQAGALTQLQRALTEARETASGEREAAENARKAAALAELRLEALPTLHAEIEGLRAKLDIEGEARRGAEIEAAELRGKHASRGSV